MSDKRARRLLLVAGPSAWGRRWITERLNGEVGAAVLWIGGEAPIGCTAVAASSATHHLGGEYALLVFDAYAGFHPDAFAAAVGTLRGGGDCVVLCPPVADWPQYVDPDRARFCAYPRTPTDMRGYFVQHLLKCWLDKPGVILVGPDAPLIGELAVARRPQGESLPTAVELNPQQVLVAAAVERVARGHAHRPLVLTADRGRGKSTLLGIAAAGLLRAGYPRVTIVAPHRRAVATLFRHALQHSDTTPAIVRDVTLGTGQLCFRLPLDCVNEADGNPGLVIVDEAAAIPISVLERLLLRSNRLVFSSTVHGYEGSGRGFGLRFQRLLDARYAQWKAMRLTVPMRWSLDDPLEARLNEALLLDADLMACPGQGELTVEVLPIEQLSENEALLREVFGLLINAHYQTRPSDLRQLLDNPDLSLWLARQQGVVVGVLQCLAEGGFDRAMASSIAAAGRRPRGHLLPQSLAVHAGFEEFLPLRLLRVQRIAVHPEMQQTGIGSRLLQSAMQHAEQDGFDLMGCAFAAERGLHTFWQSNGYVAVHLGTRIDPASATHSLFMLKGANASVRALIDRAAKRFRFDLPWALGGNLAAFDSGLAATLLAGRSAVSAVDDHALQALSRIAQGARQPESAEALIWAAVVDIASRACLPLDETADLVAHYLQHRDAPCPQDGSPAVGAKQRKQQLRNALHRYLQALSRAVDGSFIAT